MARRVFFSFHYQRDIWRVNQVRNSWLCQPSITEAGFIDVAEFEKLERQGNAAVQKWIDAQMDGTSVTCVLIGAETSTRKWVQYEIEKSANRGNGLVGIYIHNIKDRNLKTDYQGHNPLDDLTVATNTGYDLPLSSLYTTYDWVYNKGYDNLGTWVEVAAKTAGRA